MGDPLSGQNVRKPRSVYIQDVFSAGRWLASAPLHEAGKTTRSGNTLKPGVRREELGSASDNLSSDPNAYPLISTFSKPHSEVASTTHLPALKRFRKGAPLFSSDLLNLRLPGKSRFISSYSTFTRLLNLSSASAQMIPTTMQITLTIAEPAVIKLFIGMIMTVAAITMPTMPWKAME